MLANTESSRNYRSKNKRILTGDQVRALEELYGQIQSRTSKAEGEKIGGLSDWLYYFFEGDSRVLGVIDMRENRFSVFGRVATPTKDGYYNQLEPFTVRKPPLFGYVGKKDILGNISAEEIREIADVIAAGTIITSREFEAKFVRRNR